MRPTRLIKWLASFAALLPLLLSTFVLGSTHSATAPQGTSSLFSDTFADGNFNGWTIVDAPGAHEGPSEWSVVQAKGSLTLLQDSNIFTDSHDEGTYAYTGDSTWTDYHLNVDINPDNDDSVFVLFRYRDDNNFYRFVMNEAEGFRRVEKKVNGTYTTLAEAPQGYDGDWLNLQIDVRGASIAVYYEYELLFSLSDSAFSSGKIGVGTSASRDCYFDNVLVTLDGADPYADALIEATILASGNDHPNPIDILGPPRYKNGDYNYDFVSMGGPGHSIVVDMGANEEIVDGQGNDLRVYEIGSTLGGVDEEHDVFVASDPAGPWHYLGRGAAITEFDLRNSGLQVARYVRIVDLSTKTNGTGNPGSDIDAIQALNMKPIQCLDTPDQLDYTVTGNDVRLTWSAVPDAVGYNVYIGSVQASSILNDEPVSAPTYLHVGGAALLPHYAYAVTSISDTGCESALSGFIPYHLFLPLTQPE